TRKMPREVRFVEADVLDGYDTALDELNDAIDQQKGIAMGQQSQHAPKFREFCVVRHRELLRVPCFEQPTSRSSTSWPLPSRIPTAVARPPARSGRSRAIPRRRRLRRPSLPPRAS